MVGLQLLHNQGLSDFVRKNYGTMLVLFVAYLVLPVQSQRGCEEFSSEYCSMKLENILMLDSNVTSPSECQMLCFGRNTCVKFSHFTSTNSRCVLFAKCPNMKSCSGCVSGPAYPRINSCQRLSLRNGSGSKKSSEERIQPRKLGSVQDELPRQSQKQEDVDDEDFGDIEGATNNNNNNDDDDDTTDYYQYQDQDPGYESDYYTTDDYADDTSDDYDYTDYVNKYPDNIVAKQSEDYPEYLTKDSDYVTEKSVNYADNTADEYDYTDYVNKYLDNIVAKESADYLTDDYADFVNDDYDADFVIDDYAADFTSDDYAENVVEESDDNSEEDVEEDEDYEDDDDSIDDGLLDEVFNELPGVDNRKPPVKKSNTTGTSCPSCYPGYYYCIMGGFNRFGPISEVSLLNTGGYPIPRSPIIAPFPSFMTQGSGSSFSTFTGRNLMTCTPGYPVTRGLTPASTFGGFGGSFGSFFQTQQSYIPGTCNSYDVARRSWQSTGGKLNTVRLGGSTVRMGKYLVSVGGVSPSGYPINSIEMFDTRRAHLGWKPVPRWSYPAATRDACTVTMKDPRNGAEMYVIGGQGKEGTVMKMVLATGQWFSLPGMYYPRRQHACTRVDMNGRPGIMISGGQDGVYKNMTSVEFYDVYRGTWSQLPNMYRGRRSHVMTPIDGNIAIGGGTAVTPEGDDEYLSDVEVFDGRRWKRAAYTMDKARGGANLIKIPIKNLVA